MKFDKEYHGTSGPLQVSVPHYLDDVALPWIETLKSLGVQTNNDAVTNAYRFLVFLT